jgi:tRNA G10  N-methylase Trm11
MLCLFGPSKHCSELKHFCPIELLTHLPSNPSEARVDVICETYNAILGSIVGADEDSSLAIAASCCSPALLACCFRLAARGALLSDAVAKAISSTPEGLNSYCLRAFSIGGTQARTVAEKHLRQELESVGVCPAASTSTDTAADLPTLICVEVIHGHSINKHASSKVEFFVGWQLGSSQGAEHVPPGPTAARGPTTMQSHLADLTASLARVGPGSIVLDPCCGTGSLVGACLRRGAAHALGTDIDYTMALAVAAVSAGGKRGGCCDVGAADVCSLRLCPGSLDAIVADVPYGVRAEAVVAPTDAVQEERKESDSEGNGAWRRMVEKLVDLASVTLAPGGRFACWVPLSNDGLTPSAVEEWMRGIILGGEKGIELLHFLPESRPSGLLRALFLVEKPGNGSRKLLSCGRNSGAASAVLESACQRQGGSGSNSSTALRAEPYKKARERLQGAKTDVWR